MCFGRKWRSAGGDDAEAYTSQARRRGRAAAGHRDASTRALSVAVCLDVAAQRRRSPKVMRALASAHRRIAREISGGTHQPDDVHVLIVAVFPWCSQPRARLGCWRCAPPAANQRAGGSQSARAGRGGLAAGRTGPWTRASRGGQPGSNPRSAWRQICFCVREGNYTRSLRWRKAGVFPYIYGPPCLASFSTPP